MKKEAWDKAIHSQSEQKLSKKENAKLADYVVFNQKTGFEYMRTKCETVARGCYNRMKLAHGAFVKFKIEGK